MFCTWCCDNYCQRETIQSFVLHEFALNECGYTNDLLFNIYREEKSVTNVLPSFKVAVYCKELDVLIHPAIKQKKHERGIS